MPKKPCHSRPMNRPGGQWEGAGVSDCSRCGIGYSPGHSGRFYFSYSKEYLLLAVL